MEIKKRISKEKQEKEDIFIGATDESALQDFDEIDLAEISEFVGININIDENSKGIYEPLVGNKYIIDGQEYVVNKNANEGLYEVNPTGKVAEEVVDDSDVKKPLSEKELKKNFSKTRETQENTREHGIRNTEFATRNS